MSKYWCRQRDQKRNAIHEEQTHEKKSATGMGVVSETGGGTEILESIEKRKTRHDKLKMLRIVRTL